MNVSFEKYSKGWSGVGNKISKYSENNRTIDINSSSQEKINKNEARKLNW